MSHTQCHKRYVLFSSCLVWCISCTITPKMISKIKYLPYPIQSLRYVLTKIPNIVSFKVDI